MMITISEQKLSRGKMTMKKFVTNINMVFRLILNGLKQ